ncbi:hypothetical protein CVT24_000825 [Panaeolus cyanescens]|uniref:Uncharacterized protein n=1 Tax=Panaeolus cyanescens TaxID=181874 RepID=A0A409YY21_9AGAR|nr:hypothetical protein CVT24_000825 [Panaeolus cyanescens]
MTFDTPTDANEPKTIPIAIRPSTEGQDYDVDAARHTFHYLCHSQGSLNEFHEVTDHILYLKETFEEVHTKLKLLDEKKFTSYKKPNRPIFAPSWEPIYQSYLNFLSSLRESATTGMTQAQNYLHVVVPIMQNPSIPFSDKMLELEYCIKNAEKSQNVSNSFPDQLNAIYKSIEEVSHRLSEFARDVNEAVRKEVEERKKEIERLKKKVKILESQCQDLLPHLGVAEILASLGLGGIAFQLAGGAKVISLAVMLSKGGVMCGGSFAASAAAVAAPATIVVTAALAGISVFQILKATSALSKMFTVQNQIHHQRSLMNVYLAEQAQANATDQSVILSLGQMADLIPRILGILSTSTIVMKDAKDLLEFMKPLESDPEKLGDILKERIPFITMTYTILYEMLRILSVKITPRQAMHGGGTTVGNRRPHSGPKLGPHPSGKPGKEDDPCYGREPGDDENDDFDKKLPKELPEDKVDNMELLKRAMELFVDMVRHCIREVEQDQQNGLNVDPVLIAWAATLRNLFNAFTGQGAVVNRTLMEILQFVNGVRIATRTAFNALPYDPLVSIMWYNVEDLIDMFFNLFPVKEY